jgi:hypothetical protein
MLWKAIYECLVWAFFFFLTQTNIVILYLQYKMYHQQKFKRTQVTKFPRP